MPVSDVKAVCAIAVTYHPDLEFPARMQRVLRQVGALVVVDNASAEDEVAMLRALASNPAVHLISNASNLGIARALNIGIECAVARGFEWALLLDQDSGVAPDMVGTLFAAYEAHPQRERVAVIGSGFDEPAAPARAPAEAAGAELWEERDLVITSGSLIPLAIHSAVGPFREELFIDAVDVDYCFRARAKGFRVIKTRRSIMSHAIGRATQHRVFWTQKWTTNHSADRRYYIARNGTVMLREYGRYPCGLWALKSLSRCLRLCKRIALYEDGKTGKIFAVAQGWLDGIRGRLGPRALRKSSP